MASDTQSCLIFHAFKTAENKLSALIWSDFRLGKSATPAGNNSSASETEREEHRSAFQRDYDRLLFSAPVRRLADKTQVFPLEPNDSVRTRLTHSHEVSNLARSIGARLHHRGHKFVDSEERISITEILAILQSIGLAHDIGNPPFGHQGEASISNWFDGKSDILNTIPDELHNEFLKFEGNAQTIRILTRLQHGVGSYGLDLTAGTLSALMKYPVRANETGSTAGSKKYGFFHTESDTVAKIWSKTGLSSGIRHPLVWIMEAADDIAYSVLDVEDAIKKGILSPEDVYFTLKSDVRDDSGDVCLKLKEDFRRVGSREPSASVSASREIKAGYLRTRLIDQLIDEAVDSYLKQKGQIEGLETANALLDDSKLCKRLKRIAKDYAFSSVGVTRIEANGAAAIRDLMDFFWSAIRGRSNHEKLDSRRSEAAAYGWALLSDNYKEIATLEFTKADDALKRYHECRLLTDMMAGMTDGFAMDLHGKLSKEGHLRHSWHA